MAPPDPDLTRPGDILLGKYRVENVLGRGGMGIVVAARHMTLDDRVAIKFLLPDRLGDEESIQRFLREARAAVRIRSQHIARVTDVGAMASGAPYMIMEYLEGKNLSAVVARGALPVALAVDLVLQASEALAEAHAQQIVHRDVKPSNLFLTQHADGSPCVKVLDFGISKMPGARDHELTRTGAVFGSPLYMSPEQLRSARDVDARTDLYSLGVVLYELLTARVPFTADDLPQLVYKIMNEAPASLRALRPEIPEPLERAVLTAMARDRASRFPTIAGLAAAISPFGSSRAHDCAERIGGILRAQAERERDAARDGTRERPEAFPGAPAEATALLDPLTIKSDLQSSMATFGATQGKAPRSREGRRVLKWGPIALGIGAVAVGVVVLGVRSSRRIDPPAMGAAATAPMRPPEPEPEPPPEPAPGSTLPARVESSRVVPPLRSASPRSPQPQATASSPPAAPHARRVDKDPFKRDVF